MKVHVFVNGGAGSVDDAQEAEEVRRIEAAFAAADAEATVEVVDPTELARRVAERWSEDPAVDALVVAGGDGTVSAAAGAAAGTDIVVGVLPLGTFNHFAKDLGMPVELDAAAAALVGGEVQAIDVAEINGRAFVNNSVLGLYPDMVAVRDRIRDTRGWGKVRAVPVAMVQVLRRFPLHRLDLRGPSFERHRVRTPLVFVGNGVFANHGGGLAERRALSDGVLGVAVTRVVSRWGLVRATVRALLRGSEESRDIDVVELAELQVSSRARHVRVAADGEVFWMETPLRYRVRPGALRVLAPCVEPTADETGGAEAPGG